MTLWGCQRENRPFWGGISVCRQFALHICNEKWQYPGLKNNHYWMCQGASLSGTSLASSYQPPMEDIVFLDATRNSVTGSCFSLMGLGLYFSVEPDALPSMCKVYYFTASPPTSPLLTERLGLAWCGILTHAVCYSAPFWKFFFRPTKRGWGEAKQLFEATWLSMINCNKKPAQGRETIFDLLKFLCENKFIAEGSSFWEEYQMVKRFQALFDVMAPVECWKGLRDRHCLFIK